MDAIGRKVGGELLPVYFGAELRGFLFLDVRSPGVYLLLPLSSVKRVCYWTQGPREFVCCLLWRSCKSLLPTVGVNRFSDAQVERRVHRAYSWGQDLKVLIGDSVGRKVHKSFFAERKIRQRSCRCSVWWLGLDVKSGGIF